MPAMIVHHLAAGLGGGGVGLSGSGVEEGVDGLAGETPGDVAG